MRVFTEGITCDGGPVQILRPAWRGTTPLLPAGMIGPAPVMGVLSGVKKPRLSGLGQWGLVQRIGDIEHTMQRAT
jgi:hypothetical protein